MKRTGSISKNPSGIIHHLIKPQSKAKETIAAVFEFDQSGYLKTVFLNSKNDRDEIILKRGIERLTKPHHFGWLRGLFR